MSLISAAGFHKVSLIAESPKGRRRRGRAAEHSAATASTEHRRRSQG